MREGRTSDDVRAWAESWLSAPRFQRYLDACDGDPRRALALYEWNLDLGAALLKDISYFEVALRNVYDRVLSSWNHEGCHWLFDDASPVRAPLLRTMRSGEQRDVNTLNRRAIDAAIPHGVLSPQAGSVISHLSFGFWAHLTDRAHERTLWIPYLRHAWPKGTDRSELDAKIRLVNTARNRIAHHEHLFDPKDPAFEPLNIGRMTVELFRMLVSEPTRYGVSLTHTETFLRDNPYAKMVGVPTRASGLVQGRMEQAVRSYFAMWVSRDFSHFDELFSPRCRYEECYGPIYDGAAELHGWIDHMLAVQRVSSWDIHDVVEGADGNTVVVTWTFAAMESTPQEFDGCSIIHFDADARIDRVREYKAEHERCFPQRDAAKGEL